MPKFFYHYHNFLSPFRLVWPGIYLVSEWDPCVSSRSSEELIIEEFKRSVLYNLAVESQASRPQARQVGKRCL